MVWFSYTHSKIYFIKKLLYLFSLLFALSITSAGYAQTNEKKGLSRKAKRAVIGGGAGAATGAAVSRNHSKGAVIGGVVGAGAGYAYGRHKDKKHPRKRQ